MSVFISLIPSIANFALGCKKMIDNQSSSFVNEQILNYVTLINDEMQKVLHMYFKSAIENLNYALHASEENKVDYIIQARNRFVDSTTIEVNENLIIAHFGLALTQFLLNDKTNGLNTLEKIKNIGYTYSKDDDKFKQKLCRMYKKSPDNILHGAMLLDIWQEHKKTFGGKLKDDEAFEYCLEMSKFCRYFVKKYNLDILNFRCLPEKKITGEIFEQEVELYISRDFATFKADVLNLINQF